MPAIAALLKCTQAQVELLREFIAALEAEATLLLESPADLTLLELTQRKNDFARRLSELDLQRASCLAELGLVDDTAGISAASDLDPDLADAFDELFALASQASRLNLDNGQILQTFIDNNQRALDTLHALLNQDLYDARGRMPKRG